MYNFSHKVTYTNVPEKKQNFQYQEDILKCFDIKSYNFDKIGQIQENLFNLYKENTDFKELLEFFQKNQTFLPIANLPLLSCFTLLFQFNYFFMLHNCLNQLDSTNKIEPLTFKNMTFLIKKNN